jgi:hypothetical protein
MFSSKLPRWFMGLPMRMLCSAVLLLVVPGVSAQDQRSFAEREYRQSRAQSWRADFSKLDTQIPTLSPAEQQWLKTEIDDTMRNAGGTYTPRALTAMDSREYQLRIVKPRLRVMLQILDQIVRLTSRDIERQEVLLWTQLVRSFMDVDFWQSIDSLVQRKIVEKRISGVETFYYENHVGWARQIVGDLVIPYLNRPVAR